MSDKTLRDEFAMAALAGNVNFYSDDLAAMTKAAYQYADAMLAERAKESAAAGLSTPSTEGAGPEQPGAEPPLSTEPWAWAVFPAKDEEFLYDEAGFAVTWRLFYGEDDARFYSSKRPGRPVMRLYPAVPAPDARLREALTELVAAYDANPFMNTPRLARQFDIARAALAEDAT